MVMVILIGRVAEVGVFVFTAATKVKLVAVPEAVKLCLDLKLPAESSSQGGLRALPLRTLRTVFNVLPLSPAVANVMVFPGATFMLVCAIALVTI